MKCYTPRTRFFTVPRMIEIGSGVTNNRAPVEIKKARRVNTKECLIPESIFPSDNFPIVKPAKMPWISKR